MHNTLVLVVDNDHDVLNSVRLHLKAAGIESYTCDNPEEARQRIQREGKDVTQISAVLIAVNIRAPGDGVELLEKVRDYDPDIPVFFLTAETTQELVSEFPEIETISKPVDPRTLLRVLRPALVRRCRDALIQKTCSLLEDHLGECRTLEQSEKVVSRLVLLEAHAVATSAAVRSACDFSNTAAQAATQAAQTVSEAVEVANKALTLAARAHSRTLMQMFLEYRKNPVVWGAIIGLCGWAAAQYADFKDMRVRVLGVVPAVDAAPVRH